MKRVAMVVLQQRRLCLGGTEKRSEGLLRNGAAALLESAAGGQGREGDWKSASDGRDECAAVEWITAEWGVTKQRGDCNACWELDLGRPPLDAKRILQPWTVSSHPFH
ncbi:unnamed protein product [Sphagnum troendelagicum]|uniref:Uncharacterized protein n=1 Tax=Sphagnum troendelagicum TaxID=128251 RepID=A0ABP0UX01_9BRYO